MCKNFDQKNILAEVIPTKSRILLVVGGLYEIDQSANVAAGNKILLNTQNVKVQNNKNNNHNPELSTIVKIFISQILCMLSLHKI